MSAPDAGLSRQATKLYQAGHFREAGQLFGRLAEQDPENWQYPLLLGLCKRGQGDLEEALRWVRKSVELGDGQPATHYYLGRLMTDAGQAGAAREQFGQAIALDPNHVDARTGMGLVSLMIGNFERAVSELKTALRANARHMPALTSLARALVELDRLDEAYQYAAKALKQNPEEPMANVVAGRVLLRQGHLELAEKCLRNALQLGLESGEVHALLGSVLSTRGYDADALGHYIKALEVNYGGVPVAIETSEALERVGDVPQARKLMKKAAQRWPEDRDIALRLAELTMLDGQPEAAAAVLDGLDANEPDVAVMRARVLDAGGDLAGALALVEPVVAADEDCERRSARLLLARMRSDAEPSDPAAAREPLAPLLDRKTPVHDAVIVWSMVCEKAGNYDDATAALEGLLAGEMANRADRRVLHNRLGNCYHAAGERSLAWANWQKGAWRVLPHYARVRAQRDAGMLERWLAHEWQDVEPIEFDDGRAAPVLVAGWAGSGREILLSALAGHHQVALLDAAGESRRLESVGVPAGPETVFAESREELRLGRKRFLRGVDRPRAAATLLEAAWWPASAIPALARHFPGATVLLPDAAPEDLAIQWRVDGYAEVDGLVEDYRRERKLWRSMREHLPLNVVEVDRDELLDRPGETAARVFEALGLEADADACAVAERIRAGHRFVSAGTGEAYRTVADADSEAGPTPEGQGPA